MRSSSNPLRFAELGLDVSNHMVGDERILAGGQAVEEVGAAVEDHHGGHARTGGAPLLGWGDAGDRQDPSLSETAAAIAYVPTMHARGKFVSVSSVCVATCSPTR